MSLYIFFFISSPKWVLKSIKNIQRAFLCECDKNRNRWALVSWKNVCIPKQEEKLGIQDPEINNMPLSSKIWWKCLSKNENPQAQLWNRKFGKDWDPSHLIRFDRDLSGSSIWKNENSERALIYQDIFWEIKEGNISLFWQDSWHRFPSFKILFTHIEVQKFIQLNATTLVNTRRMIQT